MTNIAIENIKNSNNPITTGTVIGSSIGMGTLTAMATATTMVMPTLIATGIGAAVGGKAGAIKVAKVSAIVTGGLSLTTGVIAGAGTAVAVHAMKNMVDDAVQEATTLYDFEDEDEVVA
jgi:hypothetical protein